MLYMHSFFQSKTLGLKTDCWLLADRYQEYFRLISQDAGNKILPTCVILWDQQTRQDLFFVAHLKSGFYYIKL